MSENASEKSGSAPAVGRAIRILDLLADARGAVKTLSDIARELGIAKSSTSNLCQSLEDGGLIRRTDGGYLLGRRTVELGGAFLSSFNQVREFYRVCEESPVLSERLVQLVMLDGARVLYLAVYAGRERFPLSASVGDRYPANATAVGKAVLSTLPPDEVASRFADPRNFVSFTDRTTVTLEALQDKLARTRERGYVIDDGEVYSSVMGIAVPVPATGHNEPAFGLGVSLVRPDVTESTQDAVIEALLAASVTLTRPRLAAPVF